MNMNSYSWFLLVVFPLFLFLLFRQFGLPVNLQALATRLVKLVSRIPKDFWLSSALTIPLVIFTATGLLPWTVGLVGLCPLAMYAAIVLAKAHWATIRRLPVLLLNTRLGQTAFITLTIALAAAVHFFWPSPPPYHHAVQYVATQRFNQLEHSRTAVSDSLAGMLDKLGQVRVPDPERPRSLGDLKQNAKQMIRLADDLSRQFDELVQLYIHFGEVGRKAIPDFQEAADVWLRLARQEQTEVANGTSSQELVEFCQEIATLWLAYAEAAERHLEQPLDLDELTATLHYAKRLQRLLGYFVPHADQIEKLASFDKRSDLEANLRSFLLNVDRFRSAVRELTNKLKQDREEAKTFQDATAKVRARFDDLSAIGGASVVPVSLTVQSDLPERTNRRLPKDVQLKSKEDAQLQPTASDQVPSRLGSHATSPRQNVPLTRPKSANPLPTQEAKSTPTAAPPPRPSHTTKSKTASPQSNRTKPPSRKDIPEQPATPEKPRKPATTPLPASAAEPVETRAKLKDNSVQTAVRADPPTAPSFFVEKSKTTTAPARIRSRNHVAVHSRRLKTNPFHVGSTWQGTTYQHSVTVNPAGNNGATIYWVLRVTAQTGEKFQGKIEFTGAHYRNGSYAPWGARASCSGYVRHNRLVLNAWPTHVPNGSVLLLDGEFRGSIRSGRVSGAYYGSPGNNITFKLARRE